MPSIKTAGVLLHALPYLGQKKILKIFTPEHGLITLFATNTKLSPFCIAEWVYRKSNRDIATLQDTTLTDPLLELRQSYDALTAAGSIAQDLIRTQLPNKHCPELFALTCLYLKKLPANPHIFAASFRLKLLLHEGLLSADPDPAFTPEEWNQVELLASVRQFSLLQEQRTAPFNKINFLFDERLR